MRRTLLVFVATLFWTLLIVWTTQVLAKINLVTDSGQSALAFFEVATLILPSVAPIVIPFAVVIAVAQTLSVMNTDSELVVINAAGASRWTVIRPIMLLALGASVLSFAIDNGVDPYARERNRALIAEARGDFLSMIIQEGTFRKIEDGLFVQVGERLPDGGLGGIFVADSREKGVDLVYHAKRGAVIDNNGEKALLMQDGVIHRKAPGGDVSVIRFASYAFDLSSLAPATQRIFLLPKDRTLGFLFNPDPNDRVYKDQPQAFRAELHARLTDWLYSALFALIALAVASDAKSHRQGRIHPLLTATTISLFVRWLGFFISNNAQKDPAFIPLLYALPVAVVLVCAWFIATNRTMELPVSWAERAGMLVRGALERFAPAWMRSAGDTRGAA